MDAPVVGSDDEEQPASGTWEQGMAEHLEDKEASEPGGDKQEEEEREELQKGQRSDQISHWLTTGREETQLQSRDLEGQPEAEGREGMQLQPLSGDEEELPSPPDCAGLRGERPMEVGEATCKEAAWPLLMSCTSRWLFTPA